MQQCHLFRLVRHLLKEVEKEAVAPDGGSSKLPNSILRVQARSEEELGCAVDRSQILEFDEAYNVSEIFILAMITLPKASYVSPQPL